MHLSELSVAMIAGSTLMMLAVSMVHQSFNWSSIAKDRVVNDQRFDRLQRQFRSDVHLADQAKLSDAADSGSTLELTLGKQHSVVYRVDTDSIVRLERSGKESNDGHRERYQFNETLKFAFATKPDPDRVVLSVSRITPLKNVTPPIWRHVEAVVGRTQQLYAESDKGEPVE